MASSPSPAPPTAIIRAALTGPIGAILVAVVALSVATAAAAVVESDAAGNLDGAPLYLVAVVLVAVRYRAIAGVGTAIASALIYDLLFTEPRFTPFVSDQHEALNLVLLVVVGVTIGAIAGIVAARAREAELQARESAALYQISRTIATATLDEALPPVLGRLVADAGMDRVWCTVDSGGLERTIADTGEGDPGSAPAVVRSLTPGGGEPAWMLTHVGRANPERLPGLVHRYRIRLDADGHPVGTLWATRSGILGDPSRDETRLLALAADQLGLAIQRERLRERAIADEVARRQEAGEQRPQDPGRSP